MKRLLALPFFLILMTLPLHGATISFLVIETGLWEDAKANEYSSLWENSLMEVFFEEGHIVSNSPVLRLAEKSDKEFPDEATGEFSGAVEGGVDYFILAMLDFPATAGGKIRKPGDISLRLYKTRPYEFLYEERYAGRNNNNMNDEFVRVKQTVRRLLPYLKG
ncbi:hypothetical protein AGMMS49579_20580 [Spirochaetia bacterium]|nr:hypothetical protein AGMMS49579_20580 [Spirochaetia bacterium]